MQCVSVVFGARIVQVEGYRNNTSYTCGFDTDGKDTVGFMCGLYKVCAYAGGGAEGQGQDQWGPQRRWRRRGGGGGQHPPLPAHPRGTHPSPVDVSLEAQGWAGGGGGSRITWYQQRRGAVCRPMVVVWGGGGGGLSACAGAPPLQPHSLFPESPTASPTGAAAGSQGGVGRTAAGLVACAVGFGGWAAPSMMCMYGGGGCPSAAAMRRSKPQWSISPLSPLHMEPPPNANGEGSGMYWNGRTP